MRARLASLRLAALLPLSLVLSLVAPPLAAAVDPLQPAGSGGVAELSRALDRLGQHRRLMILGAHPDDEDDTLLAVASLGDGTEVAYLSLTRGEGGQNVIGDELGESLGVLRSEELLAGRRVDRGRQLFSRAYDFGYTESVDESFTRWPREELLVDVVRAIRRFGPQVVVAVFPPTARAGHGQHQASGALADDAMRIAGDPTALPQLQAEGLAPWQPLAFFREAWWDPEAATVTLSSQRLDPLTGHTLFQIAMDVRSLHRSQSEGQLQALEGRPVRLRREAPAVDGADGLFAGIDTELTALGDLLPEGDERQQLQELLAGVQAAAGLARHGLAPGHLGDAVAPLAEALAALRAAATLATASPSAGTADGRHLAAFLAEKEETASEALAAALGLVVDATADRSAVVPGTSLAVTARLLNGGDTPLRLRSLALESPAGWSPPVAVSLQPPAPAPVASVSAAPGSPPLTGVGPTGAGETTSGPATPSPTGVGPAGAAGNTGTPALPPAASAAIGGGTTGGAASGEGAGLPAGSAGAAPEATGDTPVEPPPVDPAPDTSVPFAPGQLLTLPASVTVDTAAPPTVPYYLRRPRQGDLYDWQDVPPEVRGEPFEPPPLLLRAELELQVAGVDGPVALTLRREVVEMSRSSSRGEVRRPLRAVPAVEASVAQSVVPWPLADSAPRRLHLTLDAHAAREGEITVLVPEGWPAVAPLPFQLAAGEQRSFELSLAPPVPLTAGRTTIEVGAVSSDGGRSFASFPLVDYDHVRPRPLLVPSRVTISAFPLELPRLGKVGYVRGAADQVPEALQAVGVPVEVLAPADLLGRELAAFDALVIGWRAYDAAPELAAANGRLLDFVRDGGLLIVQSQRADRGDFFAQKLAPLPLIMARGNGTRITDETAPVRLLAPDHAVFTTPNAIETSDWEGWVQERGVYYPQQWDPGYVPLLAMADPGKEELTGGLLVAPYGQGTFVYTGLAFFRQLPAGVPGAYRLFANLLALAKPRVQSEDLPAEGQ